MVSYSSFYPEDTKYTHKKLAGWYTGEGKEEGIRREKKEKRRRKEMKGQGRRKRSLFPFKKPLATKGGD